MSQSCRALMTVSIILFPLFDTCLQSSRCTCKSKARSDPSTPPIMAWRGASRGAVHFLRTISANDERCELRPMSRSRRLFLRSPPDAAEPKLWRDLRVMPASFNLSSMDAPMERPRMVALAGGCPLGYPERVSAPRFAGSGQELAPRRRRYGILDSPALFCRQLFYLAGRRWTGPRRHLPSTQTRFPRFNGRIVSPGAESGDGSGLLVCY
jgi:hypothetical protein